MDNRGRRGLEMLAFVSFSREFSASFLNFDQERERSVRVCVFVKEKAIEKKEKGRDKREERRPTHSEEAREEKRERGAQKGDE